MVSKGDSDRGDGGTNGSRLVEVEDDRAREAGWAYGSDLLRMRERMATGGLNESKSALGFVCGRLRFFAGGANSTLIDGGAICDA